MKTKNEIPLITIVLGAILTIISFYVEKVAETSSDLPKLLSQVIFFSLAITSFIGVYFSYKTENFKNLIINTLFLLPITSFMFIKKRVQTRFLFVKNVHFNLFLHYVL
ncbi:hypothetical protein [Finegoldia magna]|uniref:hypothetical protein n=1 Tax=Finegoldia magna TaxID=1260 RepID=UPI00290CA43B|nr:hypothetical protein [Finegoldia magna]MDU5199984.1 hypothetical protein [Finegoldia magna]MDU6774951.1 hypothetical protein [Finegoldia magna]